MLLVPATPMPATDLVVPTIISRVLFMVATGLRAACTVLKSALKPTPPVFFNVETGLVTTSSACIPADFSALSPCPHSFFATDAAVLTASYALSATSSAAPKVLLPERPVQADFSATLEGGRPVMNLCHPITSEIDSSLFLVFRGTRPRLSAFVVSECKHISKYSSTVCPFVFVAEVLAPFWASCLYNSRYPFRPAIISRVTPRSFASSISRSGVDNR
mmetsp:Transcript_38549/g.88272  ORF Transcript_38549/g.88272 Transcript_38549/m.88272 type:complete len:218 (+) Transcript_38549:671-1324(+)